MQIIIYHAKWSAVFRRKLVCLLVEAGKFTQTCPGYIKYRLTCNEIKHGLDWSYILYYKLWAARVYSKTIKI